MVSIRLMPRDEKFFELFISDGENLASGAQELEALMQRYDRLDERVAKHPGHRARWRRAGRTSHRAAGAGLHHPDGPRGHPRAGPSHGRRPRPHPGDRRDAADLRHHGADRRGPAAVSDPGGADHRDPRRTTQAGGHEGPGRVTCKRVHELENEADGLSRTAIGRLFRDQHEALEVIKWRDIYQSLEESIDAAEDVAEIIARMVHKNS